VPYTTERSKMTTITVTAEQAKALHEALEGLLTGNAQTSSLESIVALQRRATAGLDLAGQLVDADRSHPVTLQITDLAAAVRLLIDSMEFYDGAMQDCRRSLALGPVCLEDEASHPEHARAEARTFREDALAQAALGEVLAELSIRRADELELLPLREARDTDGFVKRASAEFLGTAT